jgi:hypothetical protein
MPPSPPAARPLTIELVGLVPTLFATCARGRGIDPVALCGPAATDEQMAEYDDATRAEHDAAVGVVQAVADRFGPRVQPVLVGVTSPRGAWLALRHRLPAGLHAVVAGRQVVSLTTGPAPLVDAVERALSGGRP